MGRKVRSVPISLSNNRDQYLRSHDLVANFFLMYSTMSKQFFLIALYRKLPRIWRQCNQRITISRIQREHLTETNLFLPFLALIHLVVCIISMLRKINRMINGNVACLNVMQVTSSTPGEQAVLLLYQSPTERVVHASIDGGPRCVCQQMAAAGEGIA